MMVFRSLGGLLRRAAGDLWRRLAYYGMLHAMGDPYACATVVIWEQSGDEPPAGHPERVSGLPLTALELRLARELTEVRADDRGPGPGGRGGVPG